jgi:DNA-binding transcriptional regulator YiaG
MLNDQVAITVTDLAHAAEHALARPLCTGQAAEAIRIAAGVSPTVCAAAVGVSEKTWTRFEKGIANRFGSALVDHRASRVLEYIANHTPLGATA